MIRHLPRLIPLMLAGFLTACGAFDVTDLRLDGLSPPHIANLGWQDNPPASHLERPAVVVEVSTARDLRRLAADHRSASVYASVVLCGGRSHISRRESNLGIIPTGRLRDGLGIGVDRLPPADGPSPIDGRYRYSVPMALRGERRVAGLGSPWELTYAEFDLIRNPVDLCLVIDTSNFGPRWRTNTVVIPADAIRAAVAAATPR